ncbi:MAG TPA: efflux RND transporter periplasmic adaptor subunit [Candidatus Binataceae bacterium]|nr:efflux RND transporter periplasmic adaptor subunit [Candidatus Binataceae bacterium]
MKKRIAIAAVIVVAVAAAAWAFNPLLFMGVGPENTLTLSGNIEAHESVVSFKAVQSRVTELPFDEGQWVKKGTLLAQLDNSDYSQQVAIDEAQLAMAQRQLDSAQQKLEAANATVVSDQADFAQQQIDYNRNQRLFDERVISSDDRDKSETTFKMARAIVRRDQAMARSAERDIAVAQAQIHTANENLKLAQIDLGYTTLTAPFSGVILTRQAELGEVMLPGTPVVTMADLDHIWLRAYVSETDLGRIRWGQGATITTDTYPGKRYQGHVTFIASDAEFTPKSVETHKERVTLVYRIKIDVENPNHELKPGMPADAAIQLGAPLQMGNSR